MFQSVGLPHGFCFLWNPRLLWLNIASDSLIALAYFAIPIALLKIVRKREDVPLNGVSLCFAGFIVACGLTHVMEVVTLWFPVYWVSGALKAVTASVSVATLVLLIRITPGLLAMPHQLADQRFRELIEDAPDAILQVDSRGIIEIANRTAERIFCYHPEELLGVGVEQLIPLDRRAAHRKHRQDFAQADVSRPMGEGMGDLYARRRDGSEVPVEIALSPVKTAAGIKVTAIIRDVSDRKRIERELQDANAQLNSLLESTSTCVLAMDGNWRISYMNENTKVLLNVRGDVMGKELWDAFPATDANTQENLRRAMETREPVSFENYYEPFDLTSAVQAHPWGNGGLTLYFNDISQQKRLERKLETANRRAESVLNNTSVCVYAVDRDWKFTYVNENAKQVLKAMGDVIGKDLRIVFPDGHASTREKIEQVMATRQPVAFESYYEPLDLSTSITAHPLDDGGITIYFTDTSGQRRLERELEKERAQRNQRIEVLARLSSGLAHEIKNPLAIIHARASDLAELAEEGDITPAEVAKTCASIVQTSDRAIRILHGIAAMARVGTHDPMENASVGPLVQQAVDLVQGRYRVAAIRLETAVPPNLPMLECREVQISQILVNLLNNAFDAVEADACSERWVRVQVSTQSGSHHKDHIDRLEIDVIDGGPGVAAEHKERLMQTFFTTKSMGAGIGIGLSVSRSIAEDHGGQLELRECDGHTCFRLTLPVHAARVEGVAA
jgi:PAS domain S-box-containing protein